MRSVHSTCFGAGVVSRQEPLLVDPINNATFTRLMGIVLTNPSLGTIYATLY